MPSGETNWGEEQGPCPEVTTGRGAVGAHPFSLRCLCSSHCLSVAVTGVASGASSNNAARIHALSTPLSHRRHVHRGQVDERSAGGDRPVAARAHRLDAGQRDDQVRLRRDRVVLGRCRRSRGDEPARDGQVAGGERGGGGGVRQLRGHQGAKISAAVEEAVPSAKIRQTFRWSTAASRRRCPRTRSARCSRSRASPRCRGTRSTSRSTTTRVHRRHQRVAVARRRAERGLERHHRRASTRASGPRTRCCRPTGIARRPAGGLKGCQFGDGTDVGAPRPDVHVQQQAHRRLREVTATYMASAAPTGRSSATTRPTCARRATPRVTARTRRRPPAATASPRAVLYGVERGPVCGIAPGAHVIPYRVCLVAGCFSSDSVVGCAAGDRRRRQRDQLLDLGRRQAVHRPGRAGVPRCHQRRHLGQRLGRQQRPRRGDLRPRRPVGDDGRRLDRPARVRAPRCT